MIETIFMILTSSESHSSLNSTVDRLKQEIEAYLATREPLGKAGTYVAQSKGVTFIERIESCFYNVVGLPLLRLAEMLKKFGASVIH